MKCPVCGHPNSRVLESRDVDDGGSIRRRRECLNCQHRFTTYERLEVPNLMIVKKDGNREMFDREKVSSGVYKAFEKRPVQADEIEAVISRIEQKARSAEKNDELQSSKLGEIVMSELRDADDVAYVRFASVYRSFTDIKSFERELDKLKKRPN